MFAGQLPGPARLKDIMTVRLLWPAGCHAQHLLVLLVCTGQLNVILNPSSTLRTLARPEHVYADNLQNSIST